MGIVQHGFLGATHSLDELVSGVKMASKSFWSLITSPSATSRGHRANSNVLSALARSGAVKLSSQIVLL
jgi:hypothetical protein